jgi:hypothetical protein
MEDFARLNSQHPFSGPPLEATPVKGRRDLYRTAAGDFSVPIQYRGVRTFLVTVPAKLAALREIVPAGVEVRRLYGEYGGLIVQFVDMPNTSIGPYNECTVAVLARDRHPWPEPAGEIAWSPPPCYALWLSVSSEIARHSGQAIWGYPKTLGETLFDVEGQRFRGAVRIDGRTVITCEGPLPEQSERATIYMRSLTHLRGGLCRTAIHGECTYAASEPGRADLRFMPGSRISETLLGLPRLPEPASTVYVSEYDYELCYPLGSDRS